MRARWSGTTVFLVCALATAGMSQKALAQYPGGASDLSAARKLPNAEPTPVASPSFGYEPLAPGSPVPINPSQRQGNPLTLDGAAGAAFDCRPCEFRRNPCYFTVDIMMLAPHANDNTAFTATKAVSAGGPGAVGFDMGVAVMPRFNLGLQLGDCIGVRGNWSQFSQNSKRIAFVNTDPKSVITSQTVPGGFQVFADPFFFYSSLPTSTLNDNPSQLLPPFPFTSSPAAGFPDMYAFASQLKMQVADLEVVQDIELGNAFGLLGLGLRYAYISQNYTASRLNQGGTAATPRYNPFFIDDLGTITVIEDDRIVFYGHSFTGLGPKLSFELYHDFGECVRFFTNTRGAVLLGNQHEIASSQGRQQATVGDATKGLSLAFDTTTVSAQIVHNDFHVVPVAEVEAGVSFQFGQGHLNPQAKVAFFAQYWFEAGNASNTNANLLIYGIYASAGFAW